MVSEEAIKTAQQFVDSLQVLSEECGSASEILAATLDDHSGSREILVAHMAQQLDSFAAQVCEQREKELLERTDTIATQRDGAVIGLTARQNQFERMGDLADTAIEQRDAWKQRAEAAEFALQNFHKWENELLADIEVALGKPFYWYRLPDIIKEMKAALQAKEQELAQLRFAFVIALMRLTCQSRKDCEQMMMGYIKETPEKAAAIGEKP